MFKIPKPDDQIMPPSQIERFVQLLFTFKMNRTIHSIEHIRQRKTEPVKCN